MISEAADNQLRDTYDLGADLLTRHGYEPEPFVVTQAVEAHRWFWKPADVRTLLIAESHVFTSAEEVLFSSNGKWRNSMPPGIPQEFVRLVYCLGYGENELLATPATSNRGTWQYWYLFGDLVSRGKQPARAASSMSERLAWKLEVLRSLQAAGIWLLDASVHAIYKPGGTRVAPALAKGLHSQWWRGYGGALVRSVSPNCTFIIGRGLSTLLGSLGVPFDDWVYQPNARITAAERSARMERFKNCLRRVASAC